MTPRNRRIRVGFVFDAGIAAITVAIILALVVPFIFARIVQ
jgi:hypothetical protein